MLTGTTYLPPGCCIARAGDAAWAETPMEPLGNDRWTAHFTVTALGRYEYTLEGWIDRFATWQSELSKKFGAGQAVASELLEGAELVRGAAEGAEGCDGATGGARGSCGATG